METKKKAEVALNSYQTKQTLNKDFKKDEH